jgi:predicted RNA methylase
VSSTGSVTERSFYQYIVELTRRVGSELGVRVTGVPEVRVGDRFPDIVLELDTHRLLVQVKIDSEEKLLDDLAKTYPVAASVGAGLLLLLLTPEARRILPAELEKVVPKLRVRRALLLSSWASRHVGEAELESVLRVVVGSIKEFERVRRPAVDYTTVALIAREAIEELAGVIRRHIVTTPKLMDQAQAIVGRFDFYKSLLSDFVEEEEVAKTYVADIMAYITVLTLLFLHVASVKRFGRSVLPRIDNPLTVPRGLLDAVESGVRASQLYGEYSFIVEPFLYVLNLLKAVAEPVGYTLARYLYAVQALRPEYVSEELFGRIYQEGLPPETRKNLGAFFTNPVAARLLAYLAIERWDERVLDPACGSGTLLVSAYEAKMEKALQRGLSRPEAHRLFLEEHIVGIDVMQFAKELTSINLSLQSVETPVEPRILWGDGIMKMASAVASPGDDPPQRRSIYEWVKEDRERYLRTQLTREGFDLVIMNPPFTRRERIPPSERGKLEKALGNIVRGKVGYWAYFFVASDNVIRVGGKLAAVTPEEFFVGSSAESVRRYLLLGEVVGRPGTLGRVYVPVYIVKSVRQVAFSEGASYRDYLVVFRKVPPQEASPHTVVVLLKRKLEELKGREHEVADAVRRFAESGDQALRGEDFDAVKLGSVTEVVRARIGNLKPLVAFHTVEAYRLYDRLAGELSGLPTLGDLESRGLIQVRNYNPGQFTARGKHVEDYATRLFIRRYGSRGKVLFDLERVEGDALLLKAVRTGTTVRVGFRDVVPALRSVAGVRYLDLTGREEYALVNPASVGPELFKSLGLVDYNSVREAAKDIRDAYDRYSGEILLVRRFRVTSPNVYFTALYSSNRTLSPATMNILRPRNLDRDLVKALALYLNSTLALFQLLSLFVETEGAWVRFDKDVWAGVYVPDLEALANNPKTLEEASRAFDKVARASETLQPLYERVSSGSEVQREIDEVAIKMLGLPWGNEVLNTLYGIIKSELDALQRILEESQRGRRGKKVEEPEDYGDKVEPKQRSLVEWISRKED